MVCKGHSGSRSKGLRILAFPNLELEIGMARRGNLISQPRTWKCCG